LLTKASPIVDDLMIDASIAEFTKHGTTRNARLSVAS
jgi:hypothetical protein